MTSVESEANTHVTDDGVEYTPHSMMHKAIVRMDPMKLEMLDGFERTDSGHKFTPEDSNVRVIVTGRDWSEERILTYGCTSSEEARKHIETIIERVTAVGHKAKLIEEPEITNIAVNGDLGRPLQLETIFVDLNNQGADVEYEPEQFPAVIVKLSQPTATFLLFSTGKFAIQGLRKFSQIEDSIDRINSILSNI
ncbi:hypothetical protein [Halorubrum tebenquichense]|uniref:hypothetical protein n=1 Tax=Halorubrum tebenquichense TaxID=119434 RepID=UPI0009E580CA|nr:hypothetical protein [Halorubrum tebenquichense]